MSRCSSSVELVGRAYRQPGIRRLLTVVMAVVVTISVVPGSARAMPKAPRAGYGFSMYGGNIVLSEGELTRELDAVAKTGASWLRVIIDSFRVQENRGEFNWGYTDMVVNAARKHGLNVLMTISYSPTWARPEGSRWSAAPARAGDFADFAAAVVDHYKGDVSSWEIWNEPNDQHYFTFDGDVPKRFADVLKETYPAIKRVQPDSTVVVGGLSRMGEIPPPAFYRGLYDAGAKNSFDAVAMHPYVNLGGLAADPHNGWSDVGRVRYIMAANGDSDKQIWMTELGAPTIAGSRGVSEQEQAKQISDVLAASADTGYSGPAFIFTIRDAPGHADDPEYTYGALLTADWRPKAAAQALAES